MKEFELFTPRKNRRHELTLELHETQGKSKDESNGQNYMTIAAKMQRDFLIFFKGSFPHLCFLKNLVVYFILVALGLRGCVWAFSSCSQQGLLFGVV